jgi:hypothetical protein
MKNTKLYVLPYMPLYAGWMNQQVFKRLKLSHNAGINIINKINKKHSLRFSVGK